MKKLMRSHDSNDEKSHVSDDDDGDLCYNLVKIDGIDDDIHDVGNDNR